MMERRKDEGKFLVKKVKERREKGQNHFEVAKRSGKK